MGQIRNHKLNLKTLQNAGSWGAQLVEHLTLDFGSGHNIGLWD